jgi:transcriptional/translational regulatory protein YebC/TACO1
MGKKLEELGVEAENARLQRIPKEQIRLNKEDALKILKAVEFFEEDDDVQNVYHNLEITDEVMAEMEE